MFAPLQLETVLSDIRQTQTLIDALVFQVHIRFAHQIRCANLMCIGSAQYENIQQQTSYV